MPTTQAIIITVDADRETLVVTGDTPEFRKSLAITLVDSGLPAANAVVRFYYRGVLVALAPTFVVAGDDLAATTTLNTDAMALVFENRASQAIVPLSVLVYDASADRPIAQGSGVCRNAPFGAQDDPEPIPPDELVPATQVRVEADPVNYDPPAWDLEAHLEAIDEALDPQNFGGVPDPAAEGDVLVGSPGPAPFSWIVKTIAQFQALLGLGSAAYEQATAFLAAAHASATTGVHGVGGGVIAKLSDITAAQAGAATAAQGALADTAIQPQRSFTTTANNLTVQFAMELIKVTAAGKTITLPNPVPITGKTYDIDNASTGDVYVATAAGNIEGETLQTLPPNSTMCLYSDGAAWRFR